MSKEITIKLDISDSDGESDLKRLIDANRAHLALREIADTLFRPARKHGYPDPTINAAIEGGDSVEVIGLLEGKFWEIIEDHGLDIEL